MLLKVVIIVYDINIATNYVGDMEGSKHIVYRILGGHGGMLNIKDEVWRIER